MLNLFIMGSGLRVILIQFLAKDNDQSIPSNFQTTTSEAENNAKSIIMESLPKNDSVSEKSFYEGKSSETRKYFYCYIIVIFV